MRLPKSLNLGDVSLLLRKIVFYVNVARIYIAKQTPAFIMIGY